MTGGARGELLTALLRRGELLEKLIETTRSKPELTDALDVSRSTVDRAIRTLESYDLVERSNGEFSVTLAGRLAYEAYREYEKSLTVLDETRDLLSHLEPDCEIDPVILRGAEIHRAEQPATYGPGMQLDHYVGNGVKLIGLSKAMSNPRTPKVMAERVKAGLMETEIVYDTELVGFMRKERIVERAALAETGRYRAYAAEDIPYGLFVFDVPAEERGLGRDDDADDRGRRAADADGAGGVDVRTASSNEAATGGDGAASDGSEAGSGGDRSGAGETRAEVTRRIAVLCVYDETHDLRGLVANDSPEAVAWAESVIGGYKRDGEEITESFASQAGPTDE